MAETDVSSTEKRRASQTAVESSLAGEDDAAMLAKLGYKQELRRNFTMLEVFGIAFSIMGLLPSIASTLAYSIPAGPAGLVWGWFLASMFIFFVGLAMADLGSAMPTSGGLYWWTHFFASPKSRNALSFLVGYSNTLGLVGGLCSIDYGFSLMFLSVIVIAKDGEWAPSSGVVYAVFLACVLCHGILASSVSKSMGKLQTVFVAMNFILIFATIIALPIGRAGQRNDAKYIFATTGNLTTWPTGWAFMISWLSPIWTIGAFDSCVHMSEEAANATKAVPYGILMSIGSCWLFGWILCIVIAACMSQDLESLLGSSFGQPMAQIYYDALGKRGAIGMMTLLFIVQFLMGLSITVAASRQTWAFSRDGALPFSRYIRIINQKLGFIPFNAVWFCVVLAALLGLLTLIGPAAASAVFSLAVAGNDVAWGVPILARVVWGQKKFVPGPFYTGRFSVPIAWIAIIFLCFGIVLSMFPTTGPNPTSESMNYTVVINMGVWGGALAYYYLDARKWFTGPKITLSADELTEEQERTLAEEGLVVDIAGQSDSLEGQSRDPEKKDKFELRLEVNTLKPNSSIETMPEYNIVVFGGDHCGPEVTAEGVKILKVIDKHTDLTFKFDEQLLGGASIDAHGIPLTDSALAAAKSADAILLGAIGGPKWGTAAVRPEQGILALRKDLGTYGNLRPCFFASESLVESSPLKAEVCRGVDFMIVRELTGGIYFGERIEDDQGKGFAEDREPYHAFEIERVTRLAAQLALARSPPSKVWSLDKANVLATSRLWRKTFTRVMETEFPQLEFGHHLIDSAAMLMVKNPRALNGVIVTSNLFGDIISDEASVIPGSLGLLPSASLSSGIGGEGKCNGIYEPIHGSAPDISGQNAVNPVATILSVSMMLRYSFQQPELAAKVDEAVKNVIDNGVRTKDIGGTAGTKEVGNAVAEELAKLLAK
ncbi:hypothetical protein B0A48_09938 [Cryoendolithus antarcticus]|uniref:3-isopropylmalate dehydrogenase n=1 Tax=Cryoendolithus antarcticus TaxID=1507870 RepID=A0A1V8T354_9PEZI|nr:hypothetical protein B0A48_09938 [Cryoendolithus antarcticus]